MNISKKLTPQQKEELLKEVPKYGRVYTFEEIGVVLGISEKEAERIFNRAMKILGHPKNARKIWEYYNISDNLENI